MVQARENVFGERVSLVEIITNTVDFHLDRDTAAAIGKFDGLHMGHRRLLEEILARKKNGLAVCVFTFDPPPSVFFGMSDGKLLSTREEKRLLFEKLGVDILIEFPLNEETAGMEPEVFAKKILADKMKVKFLAAGSDLSFGARGAGDAALLQALAPKLGFEVKTIDKVCLEGSVVSSTRVRRCVEQGDMNMVEKLLGMPYMTAGEVVTGNQIGRGLGFPTVNVLPKDNKLLPPCGVYFSKVFCKGAYYPAISNVGYKPTVTDTKVLGVESYLYDFNQMVYGEMVEVYLYEFYREEKRFENLEALKAQLRQDVVAGEAFWNLV